MCRLKVGCDNDSAGRIRENKSVKNEGHCSTYVQRKKSVSVCENLFRKTERSGFQLLRLSMRLMIGNIHGALLSAGPYRYSD